MVTKKKTTKKKKAEKASKKTVKKKAVKKNVLKKKTASKKTSKNTLKKKKSISKINREDNKTKKKLTGISKKPIKRKVKKLTFTTEIFTYQDSHRTKEEMLLSKYDTGAHTTYAEYAYDPMKTEEPPCVYYIDRVVVLPIDPKFAFTYWEVKEDTLNYFFGRYGYDSKLTLRVYDVSNVDFNGHNANEWWDVEIYNRLGTWYIKHDRGDRNLLVDIGIVDKYGNFYAITRSGAMYFPRDYVAKPGKVLWMLVDEFGNKSISDIEDYTDEDLELLKRILGEAKFNLFMKGDMEVFLGGSVWGRLPVMDNFLDLSKMPSSTFVSSSLPSETGGGKGE